MKINIGKTELIHFVGIGGIGMSGLALIMDSLGFNIQGSDISDNKYLNSLRKRKIPILIGIPVLILIILGAAYAAGTFDNTFGNSSNSISDTVIENEGIFYGEYDPKCGPGTVLDPETNACRLGSVITTSTGETDSKCGPGTVFDSETNSCILE